MSSAVRGWCPDLFAPMQSGDGWLARLKPRLGRLTADQALHIAREAAACGNGIIELTGRGNLQIRGLTLGSAERFARFAVRDGLASVDPAMERIRNIQLSPLAGAAACDLAQALEQELGRHTGLAALPGKFGFLVDAATPFAMSDQRADITLRATGDIWQVALHGAFEPVRCLATEAASVACGLAADWLRSAHRPRPAAAASIGEAASVIGWHAGLQAFGIGLPFGQMDADTLAALAGLSLRLGDGMLHVTPWRVLILSGVPGPSAPGIADAVPDLVIMPDDPRLSVSACIGSKGCVRGSVDARADALSLLDAGVRVTGLHVSGCVKGCAHPGPAPITLVGCDGRYGLVRCGRAGDTPQTDGLSLSQLARGLAEGADGP